MHGTGSDEFFNILTCLGWSCVQIVLGEQLFHAINPNVSGWAGILVIAFVTLLVYGFGYKVVHENQQWAWIPMFIIFLIVLEEFAHSGQFDSLLPFESSYAEAGAVPSFGGTLFSAATGLCSYASDYTVYQPRSSPDARPRAAFDLDSARRVRLAALGVFGFGVASCVLGMTQEWWTGPMGSLSGGDLGFELAFGFSAVSYAVFRVIEKNRFKR